MVSNILSGQLEQDYKADEQPELSVIIPAYNEERRLTPALFSMISFLDSYLSSYEVLVVDDGSTDATKRVVKSFEKIRPEIKLISLNKNYGKGQAVKTGMLSASGKYLLLADADGATPIEEVEKLFAVLQTTQAEVAIGSRALNSNSNDVENSKYRALLSSTFNLVVSTFLLSDFRDTQCGFKLFNQNSAKFLFDKQECPGFGFDLEILYMAKKAGIAVSEVSIKWCSQPGSKVNVVRDSLKMLRDMLLIRLRHRRSGEAEYAIFRKSI